MGVQWPGLLWGLLLVPATLGAYLLAQRRRSRYAARFTNLDLLAKVARSPGWRRHLPAALYLLALAVLLLPGATPPLDRAAQSRRGPADGDPAAVGRRQHPRQDPTAGRRPSRPAAQRARVHHCAGHRYRHGGHPRRADGGTSPHPGAPDRFTLQRIAQATNARSFAAPSSKDLRAIYQDLGSKIGSVKQREEVTAAFAAGALLLLVADAGLALVWFGRFP